MNDCPPKPCDDCPWRRNAAKGWLGPLSAQDWVALAHSDEKVACHQTIEIEDEWTAGTKQCRGIAIYRANIAKSPRDRTVVVGPVDRDRVFSNPMEFKTHHDAPLAHYLEAER